MADYKKPDHLQLKARKEAYPARSVYKLQEIDEKFKIFEIHTGNHNSLHKSRRVLDIGAAPGSWSLYVLRKFAGVATGVATGGAQQSFLTAADLSPLSREFDKDPKNRNSKNQALFDADNFFFIQGDVTNEAIRESILAKGPYTTIISDVAPATTGSHVVDSARSLDLAETVVAYAESALVPGGNLAVKIFQGSGTDKLLKHMRELFTSAKSFKPQACRGESVETYFIGMCKRDV